jgi:hypothetical protein
MVTFVDHVLGGLEAMADLHQALLVLVYLAEVDAQAALTRVNRDHGTSMERFDLAAVVRRGE